MQETHNHLDSPPIEFHFYKVLCLLRHYMFIYIYNVLRFQANLLKAQLAYSTVSILSQKSHITCKLSELQKTEISKTFPLLYVHDKLLATLHYMCSTSIVHFNVISMAYMKIIYLTTSNFDVTIGLIIFPLQKVHFTNIFSIVST